MERPKVRFSRAPVEQINTGKQSKGKIKVKSIVPTNFPIKVLDNGKIIIIKDKINDPEIRATKTCDSSKQIELRNLDNFTKTETPIIDDKYCCFKENKQKCDDIDIKSCVNDMQKLHLKQYQSSNSPIHTLDICSDDNDDDNLDCVQSNDFIKDSKKIDTNLKPCKYTNEETKINHKFSKENKNDIKPITNNTIQRGNKENCSTNMIKTLSKSPTSNNILQEKTNRSIKMTNKKEMHKIKKPVQVMPCAKFKFISTNKKTTDKKDQTQIKKSAVFNIVGNQCNVSVQASKLDNLNFDVCDDDIVYDSEKKKLPKDLLSRPEYNSIINVMENLKDTKNEKILTDYKHLPDSYKHLVSKKITTGLNFSPHEAVYKDLIDLSIDEDKLPNRLMRSKDPEPRDKDIVPKLSDFYNPKQNDQYCIAVNPKPLNPINLNTLSAFTISNKICTWKICRDNF